MKNFFTTSILFFGLIISTFQASGQALQITTTCPPPVFGTPGCFQTLAPPRPDQDCCNSTALCFPVNVVDNASVVPPGGTGTFPGCVSQELPTCCLSSNERGTIWYRFKIRPLPNGPTAPGSPAGYLRFRIIPTSLAASYDPALDDGTTSVTSLDYDFALFNTTNACDNADACTKIKASTNFGQPNSIIVSCNYSGLQGTTGLTSSATEANQTAAGDRFNKEIKVKVGEVFTLAVDNFSVDQEGYIIDFRALEDSDDSTAVVNPPPATDSIRIKAITNPACNDTLITITFSAPIRTDSVAASSFEVIGLNGPYTLTPITTSTGCFGVEDTTFTFGVYPSMPDTTLRLIIKNEIRDICGNKVLIDTIPFRIPYPKVHKHSFAAIQPTCDIGKINVRLNEKVLCSTLMVAPYNKFRIVLREGIDSANVDTASLVDYCKILNITRTNQQTCGPKTMDSLYTFTLSELALDTVHLAIFIDSLKGSSIKDSCQGYLRTGFVPFDILPELIPAQIVGSPTCGVPEITLAFGRPLRCDSVKALKFSVLKGSQQQGVVTSVKRKNGENCTPGVLDSLYVLTLSSPVVEMNNLKLVIGGVIRDKCGNPAFFDTLSFKIPKFAKILGEADTVCPGVDAMLRALTDSTYPKEFNNPVYTWKEFSIDTTILTLNSPGVTFIADTVKNDLVKIRKDSVFEKLPIMYRLYARHRTNGCIDSTDIPVLFSPKPNVNTIDVISLCYGEQLKVKPVVNNGDGKRLNNFDFVWSRVSGGISKGVSSDSVLTRLVNDTLLDFDLSLVQQYKLDMSFKKSQGGCKAPTQNFQVVLGRRISTSIAVPPGDTLASITPADFNFINNTVFYPSKNSAFYTFNFGDGGPEDTKYGNSSVAHRFPIAGKYSIRVTGYDTLYTSASTIGKICTNSDSVQIEVQNLIPSLVTANGDRMNDLFEIEGMRPNTFSVKIYNRWGKKILDQDPYDNKYDPGANLESGTYYYILIEKRSGKSQVGWFQVTH